MKPNLIGGSVTRRPDDTRTFQDDSNGMRPIILLESDVAIERTVAVPVDKICIAPSIREVRDLLGDLESNSMNTTW